MQQVLAERFISKRSITADIILVLLGSVVVAAFAQLSIPLQPVPITGQTFAVLLVGMALGSRRGAAALSLYLAEGAAGLPVFALGKSGLPVLLGTDGGYLVGFVIAAWLVGLLAERGYDRTLFTTFGAMVLGNAVVYVCGLTWLSTFPFVSGLVGEMGLFTLGMTPFLIGDGIKALLAALLLPSAWKFLGTSKN